VIKVKTFFELKTFCTAVFLLLLFFINCTEKKTTEPAGPDEPEEPTLSLMQQYFPLNHGDRWTWEVTWYEMEEEYVDGDSSLGEPFEDNNQNGIFDSGDVFEDLNNNGQYDGPEDPWTPPIPYLDRNNNGQYDSANGTWEEGEFFLDLDGNEVCDTACTLSLHGSILYPYPINGLIFRGSQFLGTYSNGEPGGVAGPTDKYSNDSLGLRWHVQGAPFDVCQPLIIAQADPQMGDSIESVTCWHVPPTWISVFEAVEDVTIPAGSFSDCYKFKFIASGWGYGMEQYNGNSYAWYAKDVGMVKLEGPTEDKYWILKSATVGGRSYP
jgi:hypothetical protein